MHPTLRTFALTLAFSICTACGSRNAPPDPCAEFPKQLSEATRKGIALADTEKSAQIETAIAKIMKCFPRTSYRHADSPIEFDHAAIGSDGHLYLFFRFLTITDLLLVYRIGPSGSIDAVFEYSLFWDFAVPG
jgi:hypothetical protein